MDIDVNGLKLHLSDQGQGPVTLVFLHYWGGTARSWDPVISNLKSKVRSIALDARGWGQSARPAEGYDIATMAEDVEAAIAALDLGAYILVGHSMGGKVAQLIATRRPRGLRGTILVAPSPAQGKQLPDELRQGMAASYESEETIAWTIDNVLSSRPLAPAIRRQIIEDSLGGAAEAKRHWPMMAISEDVSAALNQITCPLLVIGGERDKVDDLALLQQVVMPALPGAKLVTITGAGHLLPLEAPAELAAAIDGFVAEALRQSMQPEDVAPAFDAALNAGDIEGLLALFHPQAVMRMTDGTVVEGGPMALREPLEALIALRPVLHNRLRRVLQSSETALLLLDWDIQLQIGGAIAQQRGIATQIVERAANGYWQLRIANPLGVE